MVYLDNAATTKPEFFRSTRKFFWMNSNMNYALGEQKALTEAENRIKDCLKVNSGHILWFRCATEAVEWLGSNVKFKCSNIEHDSVFNAQTNYGGAYALQYVNQLTGTIHPITPEIEDSDYNFIFSDFTAAIGHVEIPEKIHLIYDAIWFSGHKFHTEKGIGAMWINNRLDYYLGGKESLKNQYNLLHGTVDVAGAMMMADAMNDACTNIDVKENEWKMLSDIIVRDLENNDIECHYICDNKNRTHAINALYIDNINGDALQSYLANKEIYVGVGHSACADMADYRVLKAYGLTTEAATHVIRISFDKSTTIHDIKVLINGIIEFKNKF